MKNLSDNIRPIVTLLTVIFTFCYFFTGAFITPVLDPQITIAVIGVNALAFGFYFNTSQGSANKQTTIDALHKKIEGTKE